MKLYVTIYSASEFTILQCSIHEDPGLKKQKTKSCNVHFPLSIKPILYR